MSPLVLITGANGFIGSAVTLKALEEGYRVRAAVRRPTAATALKQAAAFQKFTTSGALETVVVADMTASEAFMDVAQGCDYIIHVASPIAKYPFDQDYDVMKQYPALATQAVLRAAEAIASIRRVVFTSSVHAIQTLEDSMPQHPLAQARMQGDFSTSRTMTAEDTVQVPDRSLLPEVPLDFYQAGKIESRNTALAYMRDHPNASFSIVNLLPGYVYGAHPLATDRREFLNGTNQWLAFLASDFSVSDWAIGAEVVHIDDTAEAHIKALTVKEEQPMQNYLLCCDGPHGPILESAIDILKEDEPEIAAQLPFEGHLDTIPSKFDIGATETVLLGHPITGFRKIVADYIKAYLSLPE